MCFNKRSINMSLYKCRYLLVCLVSASLVSCKKEDLPNITDYYKIGIIEGEYLNVSGANPSINRNKLFVSPVVKLQNSDATGVITNKRAQLIFNNVRFNDELGTYAILDLKKDIVVEDYREGKWVNSVESFIFPNKNQKLGIVLVIDNSSSLDDKIADVKNAAVSFIETMQESFIPGNLEVGLVIFSRDIFQVPPTNNLDEVKSYILQLSRGEAATNLYTAIKTGLDMTQSIDQSSFDPDGVAIVSFTDGVNEGGIVTYDQLITNLKQTTQDGGTIPSYVVAYEGGNGVDPKLSGIATNGGVFQKTPDSKGLTKIFQNIANKVSAVYSLIYDRNDLQVAEPVKFRARFRLKLF